MKPRLAIIVPCYNYGAYLREAVESVMAINRTDIELVIVDDGSTDPQTQTEVEQLSQEGFRVIKQSNHGLAYTRDVGIRATSADYLLPLDADNKIRPAFVQSALDILDNNPAVGVVYGDAQTFGARQGRWITGPFDRVRLMRWNYIDACAVLRRTVWEENGGYDANMPVQGLEDWDMWVGTMSRGWTFQYVPQIFFDYRVKQRSMIVSSHKHTRATEMFMAQKHGVIYRDAWLQLSQDHGSIRKCARNLLSLSVRRLKKLLSRSDAKSSEA